MNDLKILVIDDVNEIRDLLIFFLEAHFPTQVVSAGSGNQAIEILSEKNNFDLIISDLRMPNGTGADVLNFIESKNIHTPLIFLSSDNPHHFPGVSQSGKWKHVWKPFTDEMILTSIKDVLSQNSKNISVSQQRFIPVNIDLLKKMRRIHTPLYVQLNQDKYIKLSNEDSTFTDEHFKKYTDKNITCLFIESTRSEEFISEFRRKVLSDEAWNTAKPEEMSEVISINTELLRNLSGQLGWKPEIVSLAQDNIQRALYVASQTSSLKKVLNKFHKIERFGYADHCTLLVLITSAIAQEMNFQDVMVLRKMAFASLFHDMSLTDEQFDSKKNLIKIIQKGEYTHHREAREVFAHCAKAAEICKSWIFCPAGVDQIIFEHHEWPDGTGFPMHKKDFEIGLLSAIFIVAEDFSDHIIQHFGAPMDLYIQQRKDIFTSGPFGLVFKALLNSIQKESKAA